MSPDIMPPVTVTVQEMCRRSGLGKTSIFKLIKTGQLRSVMICGRRLVLYQSYLELAGNPEYGMKDVRAEAASRQPIVIKRKMG